MKHKILQAMIHSPIAAALIDGAAEFIIGSTKGAGSLFSLCRTMNFRPIKDF